MIERTRTWGALNLHPRIESYLRRLPDLSHVEAGLTVANPLAAFRKIGEMAGILLRRAGLPPTALNIFDEVAGLCDGASAESLLAGFSTVVRNE